MDACCPGEPSDLLPGRHGRPGGLGDFWRSPEHVNRRGTCLNTVCHRPQQHKMSTTFPEEQLKAAENWLLTEGIHVGAGLHKKGSPQRRIRSGYQLSPASES